jgi:hypothetical protein
MLRSFGYRTAMQRNEFLRFLMFFLRRLVADLSSMRSGFETRPVHVGSVLDRVALGQVFLPVFRFSPDSNIAGILHTHLNTRLARTSRRTPGPLQTQQRALSDMGEAMDKGKNYVHALFKLQSVTMRGSVSLIYHTPRDLTC